jgi:spermidine synthase
MKPNVKLAETVTPDGAHFALYEHDGTYCIRVDGEELMHSSIAASELLLGQLVTGRLAGHDKPCVLIGGLGLGFTLRAVLESTEADAIIQVSELMPEVVAWNREFLADLNGHLLDDPRVRLFIEDVWHVLARAGQSRFDAIIMDVDNGPSAMVQKENARIYDRAGLMKISAALRPGGRVAFWSARPDHAFADRLSDCGFEVSIVPAKLYANAKRCAYTIFVADK